MGFVQYNPSSVVQVIGLVQVIFLVIGLVQVMFFGDSVDPRCIFVGHSFSKLSFLVIGLVQVMVTVLVQVIFSGDRFGQSYAFW